MQLSYDSVTTTSFEIQATGLSTGYAKYLYWYLDGAEQFQSGVTPSTTSSSWEEFSDLNPGTTYTVYVEVRNSSGTYMDSAEIRVTTESDSSGPEVGDIYIQQRTASNPSTQVAVRARGFDTSYSEDWTIYWYLYQNNSQIDNATDTVSAGDSSSSTTTFAGLSPDTEYRVSLRVRYRVDGTYDYYYAEDIYITTESSSSGNRPDYFEWDTAKVKGRAFNITASEWCRLLNNINEVREYKGYSSMSEGTGVATFTYPSKGDTFTARMYNQCIYAMSEKDNVNWITYTDH